MFYRPVFILVVLLISPATLAQAQSVWEIQSPFPEAWNLNSVAAMANDRVIVGGDDDILISSDDGGVTWTQTPDVERDPFLTEGSFSHIQFVDELHGFATDSQLLRTVDGGESWLPMTPVPGIGNGDFLSPNTGFIWGRFEIFRTDNAGQSWDVVWPYGPDNRIETLDFHNQNLGLMSGEQNGIGGLFRTTDGGQNWVRISKDGSFRRLLYISENELLGATFFGLFRSRDGGTNWNLVLDLTDGASTIARIDDDSFAVVDEYFRVFVSDDSGNNWQQTNEPLGSWGFGSGFASRINFAPDGLTGYVAGPAGIILKSTDGGHSWNKISKGIAVTMQTIAMTENGVGIAAGEESTLLRTTDFGKTWEIQQFTGDFTDAQAINENTFVLASRNAYFYRSDDAGETWQRLGENDFNFRWNFHDVFFLNENEGWLFGESVAPAGVIMHTTDGGQNWERMLDLPGVFGFVVLVQGQMSDSQNGWAVAGDDTLYITSDGWQTIDGVAVSEVPMQGDFTQEMEFADANTGWFCGYNGTVFKTTDGGQTFSLQNLPDFTVSGGFDADHVYDLDVVDTQRAYISTGPKDKVYQTSDGGANWQLIHTGFPYQGNISATLLDIDVLASGQIWGVGYDGLILASEVPDLGVTADLVSAATSTGSVIAGGLPEIVSSDESWLHTRSGFGFSFLDLHHMDLHVMTTTEVVNPSTINITIESHINYPIGSGIVSLRNWTTGKFESVGSFAVTMTDEVESFTEIAAGNYVDALGQIELSIKHRVFVPRFVFLFDSFIDQVQIDVFGN